MEKLSWRRWTDRLISIHNKRVIGNVLDNVYAFRRLDRRQNKCKAITERDDNTFRIMKATVFVNVSLQRLFCSDRHCLLAVIHQTFSRTIVKRQDDVGQSFHWAWSVTQLDNCRAVYHSLTNFFVENSSIFVVPSQRVTTIIIQ